MAVTLQFPTTAQITHIVRNRVVDPNMFIGRSFCPITPEYVDDIQYDILEPTFGMTKPHQLGTNPTTVQMPAMETKRFGTGYWKETSRINEAELIKARKAGQFYERAGYDLVTLRAIHLDNRLETRLEWLTWQVVANGVLTINDNSVNYTVDYKIPASNKIDISGDPQRKWSASTADPISDILTWLLLYRGTGAKPTKAFFNMSVAKLLSTNALFRELLKRGNYVGLLSAGRITEALKLLIPDIDFVLYDGVYLDENKVVQTFIPDNQFIIIGSYPGELMMDFVSTISLHNGGIEKPQPGKFAIVEDESQRSKNPYVDVTTGIYGLPRVFHPDWIVSAKVA